MKHLSVLLLVLICTGTVFSQSRTWEIGPENQVEALFPVDEYTPNGYLANPYHTAALNRSGVLRSVPPLGFGFWARPLPWPYGGGKFGFGLTRHRNYLSLMNFALEIDGIVYQNLEDFKASGVKVISDYHSQNMFSYRFQISDLDFSLSYFQVGEHSLACNFQIENRSEKNQEVLIHAINVFGDIYKGYWGCDGIVSRYNEEADLAVSKFYADGDIFVMGADIPSIANKATVNDSILASWISSGDLSSSDGFTSLRIYSKRDPIVEGESLGHMNNLLSYQVDAQAGKKKHLNFMLTRGLREEEVVAAHEMANSRVAAVQAEKIVVDNAYYMNAPTLGGAWPVDWKNGFLYHQETIRMNIHPPVGIYKHHWDGMQVHTPRAVLGESAIDAMALSYGDMELAKEVLLGVFADAPADNIPCSREDGSLNLVCGNAKETGTAPIWGLPFRVIRSLYQRDHDDEWISELYPHMRDYIEWWLANRTDEDGWFHCACSWESGQDGSKRFRLGDVAGGAEDVRTVDIEAAMANAIQNMILFAEVAGQDDDIFYWQELAELRVQRTRDMFVDGRFRDFDARTGEPIILGDYYSVMMLAPLSFDLATPEQKAGSGEIFQYFKENFRFWLEWPSFLFPFTEAAWNTGQRELVGEILVNSGNSIFPGTNSPEPLYVKPKDAPGLSPKYSYRLPGVAAEWWPYKRGDQWAGGCENYGWGATFPTLLIRNIVGFREFTESGAAGFHVSPSLSPMLFEEGANYEINNLNYRGIKLDFEYVLKDGQVHTKIQYRSDRPVKLQADGLPVPDEFTRSGEMSFVVDNYGITSIKLEEKTSFWDFLK
ncbi:MAG: hypothetical protein HOB84_10460 [Candidatus Marinimicrobia bacterium]|jgi:hypothetical protein|nr:hypothetical protein [Candidatus Neomarinimicrobiota bacterium]MBT4361173.1 hypothetical protein [Candidatus Neomarinimicrobiota bacterium]MBT4715183.1 hypothetical protein [Candidatus Neomarinimicrobiota bacterium]MBT4947357.1 hypothetical protein [Candidatus Neomarinimicrobiota bacterium]MBT5271454.1 hypothetical protein [Candidatus Neomarinimicrobiota bacterium]